MYLIFDVGATHTRLAWSQDGRSFKLIERYDTDRTKAGFDKFVEKITTNCKENNVKSVAGGIPGQIGRESGVVLRATNMPGWVGLPLRERIQEAVGRPVLIENDAALGGLGEAYNGAGRGANIVCYITVSTGVNGARIHDGVIEPSAAGFEIGEQLLTDETGKMVTLEALIGGAAMERRYYQKPAELHGAAVWRGEARQLARGLYNTLLHWSPDIVVLNGPMMRDIDLAEVERELHDLGEPLGAWPPLKPAVLGDEAGLYGALAALRQWGR